MRLKLLAATIGVLVLCSCSGIDAARGPGIRAHGTCQAESGFLGELLHLLPGVLGKLRPAGDGLHGTATVSDLKKSYLAARAGIHQPAPQDNLVTDSLR